MGGDAKDSGARCLTVQLVASPLYLCHERSRPDGPTRDSGSRAHGHGTFGGLVRLTRTGVEPRSSTGAADGARRTEYEHVQHYVLSK